jgi:hypothetical protein
VRTALSVSGVVPAIDLGRSGVIIDNYLERAGLLGLPIPALELHADLRNFAE